MLGFVEWLVLWVKPAGGQAVARRNAWSSLVLDDQRRAQRLEADRAVARVELDGPREKAVV